MGREKIRTEVQFIPATVKVIDFYRESFQCLECRKKEHFSIEKPQMPQPVLAKSIASPSSVAHVITQKYQFSMPLYQQEQEWKSIGRKNWLFSASPKGAAASAAVYSIVETSKEVQQKCK